MENIKVLQTPEFLSTSIPTECIPRRFAIATNILLCADIGDNDKGFLVFNYEPEKWNQWYPYFSSINDMYTFDVVTYGDIVSIFEKNIMARIDVQTRIGKAESSLLELLGITDGNIIVEDSCIAPEMWLKYSKTQNLWTFYYIEFMQVKQLSNIDFKSLNPGVFDFIPLTKNVIDGILNTGKYLGIDVVDNTLDIIKDEYILKKIMDSSIAI